MIFPIVVNLWDDRNWQLFPWLTVFIAWTHPWGVPPIRGGFTRKGEPISALGIWKGKHSLLLIEVYEKVGKCVISVCEKSRKSSGFGLFAYFKASAFTAVKGDAKV